jgi:DNA-binding response OmpR family regulator
METTRIQPEKPGGIMFSVLLVEDERNLLDLYTSELQDIGISVRPTTSGREAIESIKRERPDVVILDIKLEDMEGLQVLEEIKLIDKTIPVILNSAYSVYKSDFASWMADDYIVKSSDTSELINKIKQYAVDSHPA